MKKIESKIKIVCSSHEEAMKCMVYAGANTVGVDRGGVDDIS